MSEEMKLAKARAVFDAFCATLDANEWNHKKDEEELIIECGATGEDLPIDLRIHVDAKRQLLMVLSRLPYTIQEDKRLDVAVAVSAVNNRLVDGSFDYDVIGGRMYFRMTNTFIDSTLGRDLFLYMIYCACRTIDDYNDRFLMLSKGMLTVPQFLEMLNK